MLGGLLGIGGSIVIIPALTMIYSPRQHLYQAAALIVNVFVVVPAFFQHLKAQAVMGPVIRKMVPLAILGVFCGVLSSELPVFRGQGQGYLLVLFSIFIIYAAYQNIIRLIQSPRARKDFPVFDSDRSAWKAGLQAGLPTGFVAGLLGVGGGVICVPLQNRLLGIPLRNSIANSTATIMFLSICGAISKNYALTLNHPEYSLSDSLRLAAALVPTAVIGSMIGSRLTHVLPTRVLRSIFIVFLGAAAIRMTMAAYEQLSSITL